MVTRHPCEQFHGAVRRNFPNVILSSRKNICKGINSDADADAPAVPATSRPTTASQYGYGPVGGYLLNRGPDTNIHGTAGVNFGLPKSWRRSARIHYGKRGHHAVGVDLAYEVTAISIGH